MTTTTTTRGGDYRAFDRLGTSLSYSEFSRKRITEGFPIFHCLLFVSNRIYRVAESKQPLHNVDIFQQAETSREKKTRLPAAKALLASVFFNNCHFSVTNIK